MSGADGEQVLRRKRRLPIAFFTGHLHEGLPAPTLPVADGLLATTFRRRWRALRWCRHAAPAAAVIDHDTSGDEGLRFASSLRAQGFEQPIFVVSSRVDAAARLTAGFGITGIYEKPLDASQLGRDIELTIVAHQTRAALRAGFRDPKKLPTPVFPAPRPGEGSTLPRARSGAGRRGGAPLPGRAHTNIIQRNEGRIRAAALGVAALALALLLASPASKNGAASPSKSASAKRPAPTALGSVSGLGAPPALRQALGATGDQTSIVVLDRRGNVLYSRASDTALAPASTLKLIVAAVAYADLTPKFRFTTSLGSQAPPHGGILNGDLILKGDGDPTLSMSDLDAAAANLRGRVLRVDGRLEVQTKPFELPEQNPQWPHADLRAAYAAGSSAVSVDGNLSSGTPVHDIPRHVGNLLARSLRAHGIAIGEIRAVQSAPTPWIGWRHESAALSQIVAQMLSDSDNLFAEQLLRAVGYRRYGAGTAEAGIRAEFDLVRKLGVDTNGLKISDGSGLAQTNRATAATLALFLQRVGQTPWAQLYYNSLPLLGSQGTTAGRILDASRGKVRAKDGHLQDANTLAGYVESAHHGRLSFAFIANARRISARRFEAMQGEVTDVLAKY